MARGVFKMPPITIAKRSMLWLNWNEEEIKSLILQKADVYIGIALIGVAFFIQILNLTIPFTSAKIAQSRWLGVKLAWLISLLLAWLALRCNKMLYRRFKKQTDFALGTYFHSERLNKKTIDKNQYESVEEDADRLFGIKRHKDETKIDFINRYTKYLKLEIPQGINLSNIGED